MVNLKEIKKRGQKAYDLTIHETMFLSHLSHPHIIKYYKHFAEGDFLYILIEFSEKYSREKISYDIRY